MLPRGHRGRRVMPAGDSCTPLRWPSAGILRDLAQPIRFRSSITIYVLWRHTANKKVIQCGK
jgi:hypothetical protein